jgi:hypothetical protein
MLLAIPIEGLDSDYRYSLGKCLVAGVANFLDPVFGLRLLSFANLSATLDLETSEGRHNPGESRNADFTVYSPANGRLATLSAHI